MTYLLDANVFIQAKNLYYGMDFCPAFWDWLIKSNQKKQVFSIEKVKDEVLAIEDELSKWAKAQRKEFFLSLDASVLQMLNEVSDWVRSQNYEDAAVNTFLQVADYYLVACAKSNGHTIVTHEIPSNSPKKIKIPNVCIGLKIKCMTPYEMLRKERAHFILKE